VTPKSLPAELAEASRRPLGREALAPGSAERPEVSYASLTELLPKRAAHRPDGGRQVEIQAKYQGYVARHREEIERDKRYEAMALPAYLDYSEVRGLSIEVRQKLNAHRPGTLGRHRAFRITPAAIASARPF